MRVVGAHTYIAFSQASLFPRKVFTFPTAHSHRHKSDLSWTSKGKISSHKWNARYAYISNMNDRAKKKNANEPASMSKTFQCGTSDNLDATTEPPEPPPTTIKSYSVSGTARVCNINRNFLWNWKSSESDKFHRIYTVKRWLTHLWSTARIF